MRGRKACTVTLVLNHFSPPMLLSLSLIRFTKLCWRSTPWPFLVVYFMAKTTLSEERRRAETAEAGRYSNHHHRRNGREGGRDPGEQARGGGGEERGRGRSSENWEQESAKRTNAKSQNTRGHPIMSDLVRPLQGREGKRWESARAILFFSSVRSRAGVPQADARAPSLPHFPPAPTAGLL